jgi:glucokinase
MSFLGIEIGGTKLQLVLGTQDGQISERCKLAVDPTKGAQGIRSQIQAAIPGLTKGKDLQGIGAGFGGPADWKAGKICRSHQIEGWTEFDLAGWLREITDMPVSIDNDANVAALGEARYGAGQGLNPVFYVTLGSGVGGGLVVDERIYHGATPGEAEIGHIRFDRSGVTVESRCSGWAVDERVREIIKSEPKSLLARLAGMPPKGRTPSGEARHLAEAVRQADATARKILAEVAEDLAFALSHVVHLFHPQIIVIGGGLSKTGEPLRAAVEHYLPRFIMEAFVPAPRIGLATLGEDAVPVGALILAGQSAATRAAKRP